LVIACGWLLVRLTHLFSRQGLSLQRRRAIRVHGMHYTQFEQTFDVRKNYICGVVRLRVIPPVCGDAQPKFVGFTLDKNVNRFG
jgi:hypothetical protein